MHFDFQNATSNLKHHDVVIVVAGAADHVVFQAIHQASKVLPLKFILIGNESEIKSLLTQYPLSAQIIHETNNSKIGELAVKCIRDKQANVIMKGLLDTKDVLKAVVNNTIGIKRQSLLSHVALMQYPSLNKSFIITDCAMNIQPNVEEKWQIIKNAVMVAIKLGIQTPKVALISAVEKVNPKIISTTDAQTIMERAKNDNKTNFIVDGPFAMDNILSPHAAEHKGIVSEIAKDPDILLFPDLVSGNVFYKSSVFLGNAVPAGVIIGAQVPIILTSRADSHESKLNSILLGVMLND
ncbi:MAG: hypothetical protein LBS76_01285 [Mycoplasmataceae bacterium]|jgi:phosphate butyryltransferase|nr:hypothetical protein [Mycoplasmataceae bacterium]